MQAIVRLQELRERQGAEKLRRQRIAQEHAEMQAQLMQGDSDTFAADKPGIVRGIYHSAMETGQTADTLMQINIGLDQLDEKGRQLVERAADGHAKAESEGRETSRLRDEFTRLNRKTEKWRRLTDKRQRIRLQETMKREETELEEEIADRRVAPVKGGGE